MKFEEKIRQIVETLNENVPNVPQTVGAPVPNNQQQMAPQGNDAVAGQPQEGPTADQILQFALNSDPKTLKNIGVDPTKAGDELFQAVHTAYLTNTQAQNGVQANPAAASNPQNASAHLASTNTSGVQGASSTGV